MYANCNLCSFSFVSGTLIIVNIFHRVQFLLMLLVVLGLILLVSPFSIQFNCATQYINFGKVNKDAMIRILVIIIVTNQRSLLLKLVFLNIHVISNVHVGMCLGVYVVFI